MVLLVLRNGKVHKKEVKTCGKRPKILKNRG
jgi:hypothetical protein